MKKQLVLLAVMFLLTEFTFGQHKKEKVITIEGTVTHFNKEMFAMRYHGAMDTVKVDKEGKFIFQFPLEQEDYLTFVFGKQEIWVYLLPDSPLMLELDAMDLLGKSKAEGKSAAYCNYLWQKESRNLKGWKMPQSIKWSLEAEAKQLHRRDSIKTERLLLLEKANSTGKFSKAFLTEQKSETEYMFASDLQLMEYFAAYNHEDSLAAKYRKQWLSYPWENEAMKWNPVFQEYVLTGISRLSLDQFRSSEFDKLLWVEGKIKNLCSRISSPTIRNAILSNLVQDVMKEVSMMENSSVVNLIADCCTDQKLMAYVRREAAYYSFIHPGKTSPSFSFYDSTGTVQTIESLRGKVVFIDAWATWCGPCKREIPELQRLEEEYHDKNIVFMSISTDRDIKAWKNFLLTQKMTGLQVHQNDKFDSSISKAYVINTIPRFILLDEKGIIVSADAPRPSSGKTIRQLIEKTLND